MIRPLLLALSKCGRLAFLPIALFLFSLPVLLQGFSFLGQALGLLLQALRVRLFALLVFVVADRVHLQTDCHESILSQENWLLACVQCIVHYHGDNPTCAFKHRLAHMHMQAFCLHIYIHV